MLNKNRSNLVSTLTILLLLANPILANEDIKKSWLKEKLDSSKTRIASGYTRIKNASKATLAASATTIGAITALIYFNSTKTEIKPAPKNNNNNINNNNQDIPAIPAPQIVPANEIVKVENNQKIPRYLINSENDQIRKLFAFINKNRVNQNNQQAKQIVIRSSNQNNINLPASKNQEILEIVELKNSDLENEELKRSEALRNIDQRIEDIIIKKDIAQKKANRKKTTSKKQNVEVILKHAKQNNAKKDVDSDKFEWRNN